MLFQTEFLGDFGGDGALVDEDVHRLVGYIGLGGVEHAVVLAVVAPRVLHHEVVIALVVLGQAVDDHAVVVGRFPVVVAFLAHFLGDGEFAVVGLDDGAVALVRAGPAGGVGTGHVGVLHVGGHLGYAVAAEALLADVSAPCEGIAVPDGAFAHFHELVERQVVAFGPAPVVLYFEDKLGVEGMVRVAGERHVVVGVEAEGFHVGVGRVAFAVDGELLGQFAEVVLVDVGEVVLPHERYLALFAFGDGGHVGGGYGVELVEVVEGVAVKVSLGGHGLLRHDAVVLEAVDGVVEGAALREADITVGAYGAVGAVHVGMIHEERLAEVVLALAHAQEFGLKETERGEGPACSALVLVLDAGDGVFLYSGELYGVVLGRSVVLGRHRSRQQAESRYEHTDFFHCFYWFG